MLTLSRGRKARQWIATAAVLGIALAIIVGGPLFANPAPPQTKTMAQSKPKVVPPTGAKIIAADISKAKSLGSKTAPITVEIFSDYQCPMCKNFFLGASQRLLEDYASAGKVYFVHHDFPLAIPEHKHSEEAARWANAAAAIGKFHEAESALYTNQDSWGATGKIEETLAGVLGPANLKRVKALLDSPEVKSAIQGDKSLGNSRNVDSTPSIFVTHGGHTELLPYSGVSYNLFKPYLDYLLTH
jgi:protein-disulfide isomerase